MVQLSRVLAICSLVWLLLTGCQSPVPHGEMVTVLRVFSGQTIEVLSTTRRAPLPERVRLIGITAPDWQQQKDWSQAATAQLEALIGGDRTVLLEPDVQPDYMGQSGKKTRLAYVWQGQNLLNEALVADGFVVSEARSPNLKYEKRLSLAQEKARLTGVGIWNPQHPMRHVGNDE